MPASRFTTLAAAVAGGAVLGTLTPIGAALAGEPAGVAAELALRSEAGNAALMRGDIREYRAHISVADDFTLMSPFGGTPRPPRPLTNDDWDAIGRFFRNGTLRQDLIWSYTSPDMVVLAVVEHAHVEVGGLPAQDWSLRVTLVYRREGSEWRLAHRHADPLAPGVSLEGAAALARGAAP